MVDHSLLENEADETCALLRAMGNPHRLTILCRLSQGELSVRQLETVVGLGQSALSQHLARLRRDKLVVTRRNAQTIYYALDGNRVHGLLQALSSVMCRQKNE